MKRLLIALILVLSSSSVFALSRISTVESVEPSKFVGTWYRISSKPIIFEPACACARQVLNANADGTVGVYNSCNKNVVTGPIVEIRGSAKALNSSFTKLAVRFNGVPTTGSYWVVALDPEYRWAVVSDKYAYSLYVMSREPVLSQDLYDAAVKAAASNGAPVSKLQMQVQQGCTYPSIQ